ncbi:MAG: o-succinylbenzoate synthase [Candidatus Omnitrophota bacterium]
MNIKQIEILKYKLPLKIPLIFKKHRLRFREGFVIEIADLEGNFGLGEISPLPGFSRESLSMVKRELFLLKKRLLGEELSKDFLKLEGRFFKWLDRYKLSASVRCGVEMAVLDLLENKKKNAVSATVPVAGLLTGTKEEVCRHTKELLAHKFKVFKLKIGRGTLKEEILKTKTVLWLLAGRASLRLDCNRQFSFKEAVEFASHFKAKDLEYIEEPFADFKHIPEFFKKTGIGVALDETLLEIDPADLKKFSGVKALVLKPTILGGFERCMQFIRVAKKLGIESVISSSFETTIGLMALARFAAKIDKKIAHGLDTEKWFKEQ